MARNIKQRSLYYMYADYEEYCGDDDDDDDDDDDNDDDEE